MKIYNAFGIIPTNSFSSAGSDYYVPNLISKEQHKISLAFKAFEKSYNKTAKEILDLNNLFSTLYNEHKDQSANLVHLFLALYNPFLEQIKKESLAKAVLYFIDEYVIYDEKKNVVGIKLQLNDTLFINSGVKIALPTAWNNHGPNSDNLLKQLEILGIGISGLYVNKSGKGNAGFDVRACLVDEDYAGFVHLSQAYTKDLIEDGQNIVYCGDKLTQMMLIPIIHTQYEDITEEEYNKLMENSQRGDSGFGSQDIKH